MSFKKFDPRIGIGRHEMRFPFPHSVIAIAWLVFVVYALYSWRQWLLFHVPSYDLGIFTELLKAYSRGEAPIVPIKGDHYNLLGDHFHPALAIFAPIFSIFPSGLTLLIIQDALFAFSVLPVGRALCQYMPKGWAQLLTICYGFSWGLACAVNAQFHEIALAVPLVAFALGNYLNRKPLAAAMWFAPLVFVKEDLGLTVALFGVILFLTWRKRVPWIGIGLTIWGVLWFFLALFVFIPMFNNAGHYDYTNHIDGGVWALIGHFFTPVSKFVVVLLLITTCGLIGLTSPLMLLVLPTLVWRFMSDKPEHWSWVWHYDAILMPVIFIALAHGARRWNDLNTRKIAAAVTIAASAVMMVNGPTKLLLKPYMWQTNEAMFSTVQFVEKIADPDVRILASRNFLAYLGADYDTSWTGQPPKERPEMIVLYREKPQHTAAHMWGYAWKVVYNANGCVILLPDHPDGPPGSAEPGHDVPTFVEVK